MAGNFLLDTNIVSAMRRSDPAALTQLDAQTNLFVSSTFAGELHSSEVPGLKVLAW